MEAEWVPCVVCLVLGGTCIFCHEARNGAHRHCYITNHIRASVAGSIWIVALQHEI